MQNTKMKVGVGVLAIIVIGTIFILFTSPKKDNYQTSVDKESINTQTYSMTDVSSHKDTQGCWTMINGNVYDLTPWINQHPGGAEAILSLCGNDGNEAFNSQHGGQTKPEEVLKGFLIGKLK